MNVINGVVLYMDGFKGSDADIVLSMNKIEKNESNIQNKAFCYSPNPIESIFLV